MWVGCSETTKHNTSNTRFCYPTKTDVWGTVTEALSKGSVTVREPGEEALCPYFPLISCCDFLWSEAWGHRGQPLGAQARWGWIGSRIYSVAEGQRHQIRRGSRSKAPGLPLMLTLWFSHLGQQEFSSDALGLPLSLSLAFLLLSWLFCQLSGEHITFLKWVWILRVEATNSIN